MKQLAGDFRDTGIVSSWNPLLASFVLVAPTAAVRIGTLIARNAPKWGCRLGVIMAFWHPNPGYR